MKYFKEPKYMIGRNDGPTWNKIVKLFGQNEENKPKFFTSVKQILSDMRNYNFHKQVEENKRLLSSPILGEN